ncbi:MAG: peptidylprolyl isomerase [Calditrichia bacterium]
MKQLLKAILCSLLIATPLLSQQVIDQIAAVVGNEIILESEIATLVTQYVIQSRQSDIYTQPEKLRALQKQFLQRMVDEKMLLIKAEEDTITADEGRVDQMLAQQLSAMVQQAGSEQKLIDYYGAPIALIKRDFRKQVENRLIIDQLRQQRFASVKISRREVENFFKQFRDSLPKFEASVNISHILKQIAPSEESTSAAFEKISAIKKQLDEGIDFTTLAKANSEDPSAAVNGGDLGWLNRGDLVKEFEEVAFALEKEQISEIVQTQFGFHVMQLIDRQGDRINVQHILIRLQPEEADKERTKTALAEIREKILSEEAAFEDMALEHSDDPNVQEDKGLLGEFAIGNFQIPAFEAAITPLAENEISEPFETDFGFHILRVNKRNTERILSLEKDWQQVERYAVEYKGSQAFEKWLSTLRDEIPIDMKLDI